jgi:hypothetical protein
MNRLLGVLLVASLAACMAHPRRAEETAVLLPPAPSTSDIQRARATFDRWLGARVPGACFRVIQVGQTRTDVRERVAVTIPASFGAPNAVANRNAFMTRARELFDRALRGGDAGALGSPPPSSLPAVHVVTLPDHDSRGVPWHWDAAGGPSHAAVICDVSPSTSGSACSAGSLTGAMDAWLGSGAPAGASFQVWIVGRSIDARRVFEIESLEDDGIANRAAYLLAARNELAHVLERPQPDAGSDIARAIAVAVSDLASKRGTKRLFLLTDLREIAASRWFFEDAVPSPREFVGWLENERLVPDCRGIRVNVCGAHFSTTPGAPPFDARRDHDIRSVWTAAFHAMHATSVEICDACGPDAFRAENGGM